MEGGEFAAAWPSIVKKEIGGTLAWNQGYLPFKYTQRRMKPNKNYVWRDATRSTNVANSSERLHGSLAVQLINIIMNQRTIRDYDYNENKY